MMRRLADAKHQFAQQPPHQHQQHNLRDQDRLFAPAALRAWAGGEMPQRATKRSGRDEPSPSPELKPMEALSVSVRGAARPSP